MVDRSGERSSAQVANLRRYGVLSSIKRWAWAEMKMWTMLVAAPAAPCCPSASSFALLGVFPMITSGLRNFTQEPYSESPGHVRLNRVMVAMPFVRVHSSALQSWSVTPVNSKMSSGARMLLPPPQPMTTAFGSIGAKSNDWARGLCPVGLVSAGGKSGVKVTAASTVRGSASLLLIPSILNWPRDTPSSTGPSGPR